MFRNVSAMWQVEETNLASMKVIDWGFCILAIHFIRSRLANGISVQSLKELYIQVNGTML